MNTFNESNTIEAMLIEAAQKAGWDYVPIADVPRNESQILVEPWLVEALRRLNPALTPAQIDEVVIKLRTVCVAATRDVRNRDRPKRGQEAPTLDSLAQVQDQGPRSFRKGLFVCGAILQLK